METRKVYWKKLFVKMATWLFAEMMLNCAGLDDLADYSEFLFERDFLLEALGPTVTLVQLPA